MKSIRNKIIIIIVVFLLAMIFNYNTSNASTTLSFAEFSSNNDMYCIQHPHPFFDTKQGLLAAGFHIPQVREYYYENRTRADGTQYRVRRSRMVDVSGDTVTNYFSTSSKTVTTSVDNLNETKVGRTLELGSGYNSSAQQTLWNNTSTFGNVLDVSIQGNSASGGFSNSIDNFAKNNVASIQLGSNMASRGVTTENYKLGPFSVNYNDSGNGKITSVSVTDIDGNKIDSKYIKLEDENGKSISASEIKKNKKFYVINSSTKQAKKVLVKTKKTSVYYKIKRIVYRGTKGMIGGKRISGYTPQNVIKVKVEKHEKETEDEFEFSIKVKKGDLTITKYGNYANNGKDETEKLSEMKFKLYCDTLGEWVKSVDSNKLEFTSKFNEAKEYTTDSKGNIKIENLYAGSYVYTLVETDGNKAYYIDPINIQKSVSNKESDENVKTITEGNTIYYAIKNVTVFYQNNNEIKVTDNRTSGDLTIVKQDYNYNDLKLEGAEFKLQLVEGQYIENKNEWLMNQENGSYDYTEITHDKYLSNDVTKAGTYVTDKEGKINLKGIVNGTYKVYETKTPIGYDITKQDGYEKDDLSKQNHWVYCGEVTVLTNNNKVEYKLNNKKIIANLEGIVWLDYPDKKDTMETDGIYMQNGLDQLKEGIPVILYKKLRDDKGNLTGDVEKIASTTTDSNGHYTFTTKNEFEGEDKNIYYWELADCYVEFSYDNKTYVVVNPFVGDNNEVNSKALEYKMETAELKDESLTGMEGEFPGRAVTYQANQSEKWTYEQILKDTNILSAYYNEETYTVQNINLGILEKYDPDFSIDETIAYIKVKMKGYTYTYNYGGKDQKILDAVPTVNPQDSSRSFSASIYPTDIAYNVVNYAAEDKLQVYVVYRIDITNNAMSIGDTNYVENKMYLESLTNDYDSERYELSKDNESDSKDFALWKEVEANTTENGASYKVAKYDVEANDSVYKNGIEPDNGKGEGNNTITSFIQFKMKEEALQKILTGKIGLKDIEKAPTMAEASTYHEYLRTDNVWVDDENVKAYEGHKEAEYKASGDNGKKYYVHKSTIDTEKTNALYLILELGKPRVLSGIAFEDITNNQENKLGNGICDEGENNRAKAVKVELLNEAKEVSDLYKVDKSTNTIVYEEESKLPKAVTQTDENGNYEFEGVVPGYYYVRFTYGDGTQKIMPADKAIKSNDYKSTIINTEENKAGSIIKDAMEAPVDSEDKKLVEWYKYLDTNTKYSTAVDDMNQRKNSGTEYTKGEEVTLENINAYTPRTSISIENDEKDFTNNQSEHKPEYEGFNFGIITVPEKIIKLDKKITNVDITTQTGTQIVNGNPEENVKYLSDLDGIKNGGSSYAKAEIDPSILYGSALRTKYKITVSNESDKDYIENEGDEHFGYYYKYGIAEYAEAKEITIEEVKDYLDKDYDLDINQQIISTNSKSNIKIKPEEIKSEENNTTETSKVADGTTTIKTNNVYKITGWSSMAKDESESIEYVATSLLKSSEDDLAYSNDAEITKIKLDKLTTLESGFNWDDGYKETVITITPTTGENRSNTNWIVAVIALIVLSTGIVILKKKVLK